MSNNETLINNYRLYALYEERKSKNTVDSYITDLLIFSRFLKGDYLDATEKNIRSFISDITQEGKSANTVNRTISALRAFYKYLKREKAIRTNPVDNIACQRISRKIPEIMTEEQTITLCKSPDISTPLGLRDRAMLEFFYSTGGRVTACLDTRIQDIDFETGSVRLREKGDKECIKVLARPTLLIIKQYLSQVWPQYSGKGGGDNALFLTTRGAKMSRKTFWAKVKKYCEKLDFPTSISPHTFRHCCGTHLYAQNQDIVKISEYLGHKSITTTQLYVILSKNGVESLVKDHPLNKRND